MKMRVWSRRIAVVLSVALAACAEGDAPADAAPDEASLTIAGIGLATPESVLHDDVADVYLVSNINGAPLDHDGNGFITRLRPDGHVVNLKWIDGASEGVTLHAPKGMALRGDTLFVSDIDSVRAFHRTTGAPLGVRGVPGAIFLNDLAVGADGTLYVTDTGFDASFSPTGTDAVFRFDEGGATALVRGAALSRPNGLHVVDDHVLMVPDGGSTIHRIPAAGGESQPFAELPARELDGIVMMNDGSLLVSSWEAGAIFRVAPDGEVSVVVENLEAPADIGWDARRSRVLIPLFMADRIEIRTIR
jgi:hypothetical protein